MRWKLTKSSDSTLFLIVFAVGLLLAGGLVYRWINRASLADREQQVDFLNAAMRSFRGELIAPLLEIRATFRPIPHAMTTAALDQYLKTFYEQWKSSDANGPLISNFSVATIQADGKVKYRTLDPKSGKFLASPMPQALATFRPRVENITNHRSGHVLLYRAIGFPFTIEGHRPVIVIPLMKFDGEGQISSHWWRARGGARSGPPPVFSKRQEFSVLPQRPGAKPFTVEVMHPPLPGRLRGWCFLGVDLNYFKQRLLPRLVERSFSKVGLANYHVGILSGNPQVVVFSSIQGLRSSAFASPDEETELFGSFRRPDAAFRARAWGFFLRAPPNRGGGDSAVETIGVLPRPGFNRRPLSDSHFREASTWVLVAKNKAGSIDALVARARRRNLALGFGVLLLLAFSMGSLVVTTHRARELARREMEFVAGVSHEFRTPLASIQSAGFNLASGVIRKSSRVQEYGQLVQNEARRLTDLIEQVMSYAGIQSGGKHYELVPTEISGIVERAIAEYGPTFRNADWEVDTKVSENLPPVLAEASAVESAVRNLISNAIKYAGSGKWLRITAAPVPEVNPVEVQISVEDHGPGVDTSDLPHIFEPFYRGHRVMASTVPGAGLGLSIVKRHLEGHGGRVSVENTNGMGSRFSLYLPAYTESRNNKAV